MSGASPQAAERRDPFDAFGIYGIGGIVGALGTGIVYAPGLGGPGGPGGADYAIGSQMVNQLLTVATTIVWAGVGTAIAILVAETLTGPRVSGEVERDGLDINEHGERAYNF